MYAFHSMSKGLRRSCYLGDTRTHTHTHTHTFELFSRSSLCWNTQVWDEVSTRVNRQVTSVKKPILSRPVRGRD